MGRSPISKIIYMIYMFYTVKIHSALSAPLRLCVKNSVCFVIFVAKNSTCSTRFKNFIFPPCARRRDLVEYPRFDRTGSSFIG